MCGLLSAGCVNITPVIHSLHLQRLYICINDLCKHRNFRLVVLPNLYRNGSKMNLLFHLCLPCKCTCMSGLRLALYLAVFFFFNVFVAVLYVIATVRIGLEKINIAATLLSYLIITFFSSFVRQYFNPVVGNK